MKAVINGKRYSTNTGQEICDVSPRGFDHGDFRYEDTKLYRTPRGNWFLSGKGGPMSRWGKPSGLNGWMGGSGIWPIGDDEARGFLERHGAASDIETYFADTIEDA